MKGLLIAYSFYPVKLVGALRPTYWAEEISNHSDIELDVITATETDFQKATYIPNTGSSWLSFFIKDEGLKWKENLLDYFKSNDISEYKFVILTGGPFFHFYSISRFLKKKGLKIIVDFRDPFSYNPRFNEKGLKKWIKQGYERATVRCADLIISVNKECHSYIAPSINCKRAIIPNGFDERKIPISKRIEDNDNSLFYAGRFYWNPSLFLTALKEDGKKIYHAGHPANFNHPLLDSSNYEYLGTLHQQQLYERIIQSEIGVVFTMNVPFESTTKIYDYIGLNKKILVITQGEPNKGALMRELSQYPFYRWVGNDKQAISEAIKELIEMKTIPIDTSKFSRLNGLKQLIHEIQSLF